MDANSGSWTSKAGAVSVTQGQRPIGQVQYQPITVGALLGRLPKNRPAHELAKIHHRRGLLIAGSIPAVGRCILNLVLRRTPQTRNALIAVSTDNSTPFSQVAGERLILSL
jgi:hypothetical protein